MNGAVEKIKQSGFIRILKSIISSKYFPFILACLSLLCYYTGADIVYIYITCVAGLLVFLLLEDVTPIISVFLFMSILISYKNSPSNIMGCSDYYFRTEILVQIILIIVILGSAALYRAIKAGIKLKFKFSSAFTCLLVFAAAMLLNGIFSKNYTFKNMLYGLIMALAFAGIFAAVKENIKPDKETFEKIAFAFTALASVLIIELVVTYFTAEGLLIDGRIIREKLTFGWGIWNTMGMMLSLCMPATIYLACNKKFGFFYGIFSVILVIAIVMSCSRQAIICTIFAYPACFVIMLIRGKNRISNLCVLGVAVILAIILILAMRNSLGKYFRQLFTDLLAGATVDKLGNGRLGLWKGGIVYFSRAPIFGGGFYSNLYKEFGISSGFSGLAFLPPMCHNTLIQLLSCSGLVGFTAYCVHRFQTIKSFWKNRSAERIFIAFSIVMLLAISFVDNHMFNIFPTIIYSCLISVLFRTEQVTA